MKVVLYFTKGVARWIAQELQAAIPGVTPEVEAERFFIVDIPPDSIEQLEFRLRTVDDVRLLLAGPANVESVRDFIAMLKEAEAVIAAAPLPVSVDSPWSVTVSARNAPWQGGQATWAPLTTISALWPERAVTDMERHTVDLRVQVDGSTMHMSLNAWSASFKKRKPPSGRPGALRPTVATALVRAIESRLKGPASQTAIYDPCCGTGTILIEAAALGHAVCGADIDPAAVQMSRQRLNEVRATNAARKGAEIVSIRDVSIGFPALPSGACVASNLPWGKQILLENPERMYDGVARGTASVLRSGGVCAYLTTDPRRLVARLKKEITGIQVTETRIGLLGQTPTVVEVYIR